MMFFVQMFEILVNVFVMIMFMVVNIVNCLICRECCIRSFSLKYQIDFYLITLSFFVCYSYFEILSVIMVMFRNMDYVIVDVFVTLIGLLSKEKKSIRLRPSLIIWNLTTCH